MVLVKTFDNEIFTFEDRYLYKSKLLESINKYTSLIEPLPLLINFDILDILYKFMKVDTCSLSNDYNPYDIKFKQSDVDFFSSYDCNKLIELSNGCSYLEYYFGLEVCCKLIADKLKNKSVKTLKNQIGDSNNQENRDFEWLSSDDE